jgi:pimeloyl-ACP methyl ester carboxylesterase
MTASVAQQVAVLFTRPHRTAMPKTPLDYGMEFKAVEFPALDGVNLSAWFIPAKQSNQKLAVMNHPLYCSKYGFVPEGDVAQLVPVHVEFMKTAQHLHNAGFDILFYDLRNHGESAATAKGFSGIGAFEWQDAAGAMVYVNQHPQLSQLPVVLVNHCMGANSAIIAMSKRPDLFTKVKALVAVQPISMAYMAEKVAPMLGGNTSLAEVDQAIKDLAQIGLDDMSPMSTLKDLKVPVLYSQVRQDALTSPADLEAIVAATPTETQMVWIEGNLNRFDGYNYYGEHPEVMLEFIAKHMA